MPLPTYTAEEYARAQAAGMAAGQPFTTDPTKGHFWGPCPPLWSKQDVLNPDKTVGQTWCYPPKSSVALWASRNPLAALGIGLGSLFSLWVMYKLFRLSRKVATQHV